MTQPLEEVCTLDDLREFVNATLCRRENLVRDQFRMIEMELKKAGRICGMQFSIHGPRQLRLSAVWAADKNVIYFYDPGGARFQKTALKNRIAFEADRAAA
mgnify:CR=1 FL=1